MVRHKADQASLICRTRSDQTVVLKQKSRVELGLKSKSAVRQCDGSRHASGSQHYDALSSLYATAAFTLKLKRLQTD